MATSTNDRTASASDGAPPPVTGAQDTVWSQSRSGRLVALIRPEYVLAVFLTALVVWFTVTSDVFLTVGNIRNIFIAVSVLGILAIPSTIVIISGNVDLSVGSNVAFSGMVFGLVATEHGLALGLLAGLLAGLGVGLVNGVLVTVIGINSIITTLGTLSVFRGAAKLVSNGQTVIYSDFTLLGSENTLGVPNGVIVLVLVAVAAALTLRYTVFGRSIYAIGSNAIAARLAGIGIRKNVFIGFAVTGLLGGVGGLMVVSQLRAAAPVAALGLELSVVAAVLLGGASLNGGRGTVWGALLGVLILGTLNNGLTILSVSSFWQEIARGAVLIAAVGLDQVRVRLEGA